MAHVRGTKNKIKPLWPNTFNNPFPRKKKKKKTYKKKETEQKLQNGNGATLEEEDKEAKKKKKKKGVRLVKTATAAYQIHQFRQFRLESAISAVSPNTAYTARVGSNQLDSAQIGPNPSCISTKRWKKKKKKKCGKRGPTWHQHTVSGVPRASPCLTLVRLLWHRIRASQPKGAWHQHKTRKHSPIKKNF